MRMIILIVHRHVCVMYKRPYGEEKFIPREIEKAMRAAWSKQRGQASLIQDKNATPSEPVSDVQTLSNTLRPLEIVAGRSANSLSEAHNEHKSVFQRFKDLDINTGSYMLDQHRPQYIGMTFPFSLPAAVGGIDIRGQDRWRRPSEEEVFQDPITGLVKEEQNFWPGFSTERQVAGAIVRIFDITRSLSQRIEGQYRRGWNIIPGLWNLYFRDQISLGASLKIVSRSGSTTPGAPRARCCPGGCRFI